MNNKLGVIYEITCITENKSYVGKRELSANEFLMSSYYGSGMIIRHKVKAHGKHDFKRRVVEEIDISTSESRANLGEREKYWINALNTMWPNGYNLLRGGVGGYTHTPSAKSIAQMLETRRRNNSVVGGTKEGAKKRIENGTQAKWTSESVLKGQANRRAKGLHVGGTPESSKKAQDKMRKTGKHGHGTSIGAIKAWKKKYEKGISSISALKGWEARRLNAWKPTNESKQRRAETKRLNKLNEAYIKALEQCQIE